MQKFYMLNLEVSVSSSFRARHQGLVPQREHRAFYVSHQIILQRAQSGRREREGGAINGI